MRSAGVVLAALAVSALVAGRVLGGDEKDRINRGADTRRVVPASEDPCQWVTATLPVDANADATVFRGPFFLTYLAPGDPLPIIATPEGAEATVIARITEVSNGTRILIPEHCYVVAPKGHATGRLYSGFRPYGAR